MVEAKLKEQKEQLEQLKQREVLLIEEIKKNSNAIMVVAGKIMALEDLLNAQAETNNTSNGNPTSSSSDGVSVGKNGGPTKQKNLVPVKKPT